MKQAFTNTSSSRSISMRDIKLFSSGLYPALQACGVTRPTGHCTRGFTLIELLVVVLIIGILSAIALPQYQKAVERSRAAEGEIVLRALRDAQARCILANGNSYNTCSEDDGLFDMMDIELPEKAASKIKNCEDCARRGKYFVYAADGPYLYAERLQDGVLLYDLETTAHPGAQEGFEDWYNQIVCKSRAKENACKAIGYSVESSHNYLKKP